jgi:hypothetical protein
MKSLIRFVLGLTVVLLGTGVIAVQPAALVWAGQSEHDHAQGAGAPATAAAPQAPAQDMMARMSALDDQIKALGAEMNAATTTDAKLTAVTKLLNVLLEQRSMMRMQMDMQGKMMEQMMSMHQMMQKMMSASPDKAPH